MPTTRSVRGTAGNATLAEFWGDAGSPPCFRISAIPQSTATGRCQCQLVSPILSVKRPLPVKKETPSICISPTRSIFGVRVSIWQVVAVVVGAGIGALIDGHLYSDAPTIGAVLGLMFGTSGAVDQMNRRARPARS